MCEKDDDVYQHLDWFVTPEMLENLDNTAILDAVILNDAVDDKINDAIDLKLDNEYFVRFNSWCNRFSLNILSNRYK